MTRIKNPLYSKFRNAEFLQFMNTVLDVYKKHQSKTTDLQDRIVTFENAVKSMMLVLNENKGVTPVAELKPLDKMRVKAIRGLRWFLQSEVYRERPDRYKHAALLLQSFMQHCGDIDRFSFQHKTVCINKMLEEWQTDERYVEAVKAINAESWVQDLTDHNTVFYQKYFVKAESSDREIRTNELKATIRAVYEDLSTDTFALSRVSPDKENYQALIKSLNNVISMNNDSVESRRPRRRKEEPPMPTLPVPL